MARLGRVDPSLLKPIVHRGAQAQRDRILIQARDGFVRARTQLVNQVRGFAKALGTRVPASSTEAFRKPYCHEHPAHSKRVAPPLV